MTAFLSFSLFYLSFTPLWITIVFNNILNIFQEDANLWTEKISIGAIILVFLFSYFILNCFLKSKNNDNIECYLLKIVKEKKFLTVDYLLSYILPLFAFDFTIWHEVISFLIFFTTFGFLCIHHNYFSVNIILELLRYKIYQCELETEDNVKIHKNIISKNELNGHVNMQIKAQKINNEYFIER